MPIEIHDMTGRLPSHLVTSAPTDLDGVLFVPDHTVPLHSHSVNRFLAWIRQNRPACFIPEIPVASELGLPRYDPLMYWIPAANTPVRRVWERLRRKVNNTHGRNAALSSVPKDSDRFTDLSQEEQIHYFATHLPALCPKPVQVSVIVTNTCNLKCVMCPYHSPLIRPTHQTSFFEDRVSMPWEVLDRLASECGENKIPVKIGNVEEPMLHPRLVDFVHACRSRGVPWIHITTNGLLLTEDIGRKLLDAGLTSIYVSMDAARAETYKEVRGASLTRLEKNVQNFLKLRDTLSAPCSVMVSFVRNRGVGVDEQDAFRERWVRESDGVIFYNLAEYESGNSKFSEINEVAREMMRRVGGRWPCLNPWQEIYVLPDGRTYYCCETVSKLAFEELEMMGRYPEQGILELWAGEPFTALRRDLILNQFDRWPACRDCGIWMAHVTSSAVHDGVRTTTNMITEIVQAEKSDERTEQAVGTSQT